MDQAMLNPINGWTAAVQNFGNQAADIAGQTQSLFAGAFSGMTDSIYNFALTGKLSMTDMARTFAAGALRMLIQWGTAQVAMAALNAFTSTAAIPIVGPFAAPAAAASALGSAGSFMSTINSVAGMAHDGIDSVPKTGTWLLEKGERVVTSQTSRKLDATLESIRSGERVSTSGGGGSGSGSSPMALTVNLIEDKSNPGQVTQSTNDDGENILQITVASIMGDTQVYQAISTKFGLSGVGS
jgi:hypothetical protein